MSLAVRKALIKLLISAVVLVSLVLMCFTDMDGGLKAVVIVFVVILVFPITLLFGIDAGRIIKKEHPSAKWMRVVGRALILPQVLIGVVLLGAGVITPTFALRELANDISANILPAWPITRIVLSALAFFCGLQYVREGLGLRDQSSQDN